MAWKPYQLTKGTASWGWDSTDIEVVANITSGLTEARAKVRSFRTVTYGGALAVEAAHVRSNRQNHDTLLYATSILGTHQLILKKSSVQKTFQNNINKRSAST